ncbi:hypothetical protein EVAR_63988_1 [Eumeta japonica]|uniref:Nucleic-acid-binding protein from transposon X-element n=1 Tax=Eumeta variegata TaxID=151549 RepID=A0A4C1ZER5_EUMVA|nr:hypothetical protein EVAR_63988_1 [Eumeta japonica]
MVLAILEKNDRAKEIFKELGNVCGLSGILVEAPYKKRVPSQCQLYGHAAANCYAQPRCVKCLVPHWTKDCERTKESGGKLSCYNCHQDHTANYGGCPEAPKPKPLVAKKVNSPNKLKDSTIKRSQFPFLGRSNNKTVRKDKDMPSCAGGKDYGPPPLEWKTHGKNHFHGPYILDIALTKGVALKLSCIETLQCLNSDHRYVLMRLGSLTGDYPPPTKIITSWKEVSVTFEETDTPISNNIPNDIVSTDNIDNAIGVLTNHIRTVVENSSRTVPTKSNRRELPRDVSELIRDKNAALRRAGKYPTCENRSHARAFQRKGLAKSLKTEGAVPTPALKRPYSSMVFNDREKAELLADSIELQCSENPSFDSEHVKRVEQEVRHRVSLPPKDNLDPITLDKYSSVRTIRAGVPQGSTLSPLLYSADLTISRDRQQTSSSRFPRMTQHSFYVPIATGTFFPRLQRAINKLTQWLRLWRIENHAVVNLVAARKWAGLTRTENRREAAVSAVSFCSVNSSSSGPLPIYRPSTSLYQTSPLHQPLPSSISQLFPPSAILSVFKRPVTHWGLLWSLKFPWAALITYTVVARMLVCSSIML